MKPVFRQFVVFLSLLAPLCGQAAYDDNTEKRWQNVLAQRITEGRLVRLKAGQRAFIGIYRANTGPVNAGGVILVHDIGRHPDWQSVTRPLRIGLARHGWHTLSIQMPVLDPDKRSQDYEALFDDARARINAAIAFMNKNKSGKIVLLGHGMGAWMSLYAVSTTPKMPIEGLILVGITVRTQNPKLRLTALIERLELPVLDIYGEDDEDNTLETAALRRQAARKAGLVIPVPYRYAHTNASTYRQLAIDGANHEFDGQADILLDRIRGWLRRLPDWRKGRKKDKKQT